MIDYNEIRKDFYRFRNGILAERLQRSLPFKTVYGLILPQIIEIAEKYPQDLDFAMLLWKEKKSREDRLLAILLIPVEKIGLKESLYLTDSLETKEEAEILAFKLLRNLPFSKNLYLELKKVSKSQNPIKEYCTQMLGRNLNQV